MQFTGHIKIEKYSVVLAIDHFTVVCPVTRLWMAASEAGGELSQTKFTPSLAAMQRLQLGHWADMTYYVLNTNKSIPWYIYPNSNMSSRLLFWVSSGYLKTGNDHKLAIFLTRKPRSRVRIWTYQTGVLSQNCIATRTIALSQYYANAIKWWNNWEYLSD